MIAIMTSIYVPFIRLLSTPFLISFSFISHFSSGALDFAVGWHDSLSIWYSLIEWKNNNRCIDSRGKSQQVNQNGVAFQSIEIQKCCPHRSKARSVHSWHCVSLVVHYRRVYSSSFIWIVRMSEKSRFIGLCSNWSKDFIFHILILF